MVLEYFSLKRGESKTKEAEPIQSPVLSEEDEQFLKRITSEENPPPLPARPVVILDNGSKPKGKDAQIALMDGADQIPLPASPPIETDIGTREIEKGESADKPAGKPADAKKADGKKRNYWAFISSVTQRSKGKNKAKEEAAESLASAAETFKSGGAPNVNEDGTVNKAEAKKEEEDLSKILDQLNLAAVNNRVFSFSKESQDLMDKFKLVLKDLVNGVPTAYNDLEKLLKNSDDQLKGMYEQMPPFLKNLVKTMPAKMSAALGPEFLAAAAEKPGVDKGHLDPGSSKAKRRVKIPSLQRLVSQQGAIVGMLRAIMNFLKLRFPAFVTGTNVLMSLALFLLLFVLWYCHKRGRETRLEKERTAAEASGSDLEVSEVSDMDESIELSPTAETHAGPASQERTRATVADLPSVSGLPEPTSAAEHAKSPLVEKVLADGNKGKGAA